MGALMLAVPSLSNELTSTTSTPALVLTYTLCPSALTATAPQLVPRRTSPVVTGAAGSLKSVRNKLPPEKKPLAQVQSRFWLRAKLAGARVSDQHLG